jgi:putative endonuclease
MTKTLPHVIPAKAGIHTGPTPVHDGCYCVYILANQRSGTLYTGMTSDIVKRMWEHKNEAAEGFTKKYDIKNLVYYERHATPENAIQREKQIKDWKRQWKIELIEANNPNWYDLYDNLLKLATR